MVFFFLFRWGVHSLGTLRRKRRRERADAGAAVPAPSGSPTWKLPAPRACVERPAGAEASGGGGAEPGRAPTAAAAAAEAWGPAPTTGSPWVRAAAVGARCRPGDRGSQLLGVRGPPRRGASALVLVPSSSLWGQRRARGSQFPAPVLRPPEPHTCAPIPSGLLSTELSPCAPLAWLGRAGFWRSLVACGSSVGRGRPAVTLPSPSRVAAGLSLGRWGCASGHYGGGPGARGVFIFRLFGPLSSFPRQPYLPRGRARRWAGTGLPVCGGDRLAPSCPPAPPVQVRALPRLGLRAPQCRCNFFSLC